MLPVVSEHGVLVGGGDGVQSGTALLADMSGVAVWMGRGVGSGVEVMNTIC